MVVVVLISVGIFFYQDMLKIKIMSKLNFNEMEKEYYPPSDSYEYFDGTTFYNMSGDELRSPSEYCNSGEGYTPFGDE